MSATPIERTDIVFLDPPYRYLTEQPEPLQRLAKILVERHLTPTGLVIFRHDTNDALDLPPLVRYDAREYGGMAIEFLAIAQTSKS